MSEEKRILQCLNCGQPFEPTCHITRQKFCCDACRHKYNNAKRHYDVPIDICPGCGDIVEQSGERGRRRRNDDRQENEQKQSAPIVGRSFRQNGAQENNGGSAATRVGSNGGQRITKRIPAQKNRRRHVRPVEHRCRGSKKARNIAVGFVTCWRWTRHMWKGPASGAVVQSLPPLG